MVYCQRTEIGSLFPGNCYYHRNCIVVDREFREDYYRKCEDELRVKFGHEEKGERRVKDKLREILKEQASRYKGKSKIKMLS